MLMGHSWPGNVRELQHCISQAIVFSPGGWILPEHIRLGLEGRSSRATSRLWTCCATGHGTSCSSSAGTAYHHFVSQVEAAIIREAVKRTGGNMVQASRLLGSAGRL